MLIQYFEKFLCTLYILTCNRYFLLNKAYVVNRCRSMPRTSSKQKTHVFSVVKWWYQLFASVWLSKKFSYHKIYEIYQISVLPSCVYGSFKGIFTHFDYK